MCARDWLSQANACTTAARVPYRLSGQLDALMA